MSQEVRAECWARVCIYEPFRLGPSWNWYRYKVEATECTISGISAFVHFDEHAQKFKIHELTTGGFLGENAKVVAIGGASNMAARARAIAAAKHDIDGTPDLQEQISELGPSANLQEYDTHEAQRRMAKNTEE